MRFRCRVVFSPVGLAAMSEAPEANCVPIAAAGHRTPRSQYSHGLNQRRIYWRSDGETRPWCERDGTTRSKRSS
jgi:hypothetical protein